MAFYIFSSNPQTKKQEDCSYTFLKKKIYSGSHDSSNLVNRLFAVFWQQLSSTLTTELVILTFSAHQLYYTILYYTYHLP
jgi:hypothetical protein